MKKNMSLPARFFISYMIIIALILGSVGMTIFAVHMHSISVITDNSIRDMATVVTNEPGVRQAFKDKKVSPETMLFLDKLVRSEQSIDYITLALPDGIRLYHPDHQLIGKHFVGGDEVRAVNGESGYIVDGTGTRADQRRHFTSMKDEDGTVLGFVMVSRESVDIAQTRRNQALMILLIFIASTILAGILAFFAGRRIRLQLLGYEPYEIARMFTQREGILDELEEGLLLVNEDSRCEYVNKTASQMLSRGGADQTVDFVSEHIAPLRSGREVVSAQTVRSGDNTFLIDIIPLIDKGVFLGDLVVLRDKTEATKMAAQLTGIDQIISALRASTHETKNKMHVILGLLQLGESEKAIEYIQSSAENDSEADTIRQCIMNDTLAALLIGKRSRARELNIDFTVRKDSFVPEHSRILSSADLVTIIGNLIENSFDALASVEGRPREVAMVAREDEDGLFISVSDTGCGMTKETIEKIKRESFTTKTEEGHGIGMDLIRKILGGYDSVMDIESELGEGTMINIMIKGEQASV